MYSSIFTKISLTSYFCFPFFYNTIFTFTINIILIHIFMLKYIYKNLFINKKKDAKVALLNDSDNEKLKIDDLHYSEEDDDDDKK